VPQAGTNGRTWIVPRGKVLGGSSAMNAMCYNRAAAAEYDAWGKLGSPGWSFDAMIGGMTKSENFTGTDTDVHGSSGPIRSTFNRIIYPILNTWRPTASNAGVNINDGHNMGGKPVGAMFQVTNIDNTHHTRAYSASEYLPLAGKNLVVLTNTEVGKVNLAKAPGPAANLKATGITLKNGTVIMARKEVILSSGSIGSPGLLEKSGIGQSAVLNAAGITPMLDLPGVGENYQDHIRASVSMKLKDGMDTFDPLMNDPTGANATGELQKWKNGVKSLYEYTTSAYGFMTWNQVGSSAKQAVVAAAQAACSSTNVIDQQKLAFLQDSTVPDVELIFEANYFGAYGYPGTGNYATLIATVMHPLNRGGVHINPADPTGKPVIDPKYMSNEHDILALTEALKYARRIANTEPMKSMFVSEYEPGTAVQTDAQWRNFTLTTAASFFHPVGTCAMLPKAQNGVVDANLKVYGTTNLRVVDASIMPVIISAHMQTAVYGIAEVAAAKILAVAPAISSA